MIDLNYFFYECPKKFGTPYLSFEDFESGIDNTKLIIFVIDKTNKEKLKILNASMENKCPRIIVTSLVW